METKKLNGKEFKESFPNENNNYKDNATTFVVEHNNKVVLHKKIEEEEYETIKDIAFIMYRLGVKEATKVLALNCINTEKFYIDYFGGEDFIVPPNNYSGIWAVLFYGDLVIDYVADGSDQEWITDAINEFHQNDTHKGYKWNIIKEEAL